MLSIIIPTIRLERLPTFIDSLLKSYSGECELIFVSPFQKPDFLRDDKLSSNVKLTSWIVDKGNPVRCQQIGLCHAHGEYVHRAVDDSIYEPQALDNIMGICDQNTVVAMKFTESNSDVDKNHPSYQDMNNPKFYKLEHHKQALRLYVPPETDLINFAIYPTEFLKQIGGWDSVLFETIALAETDLSIRINFSGIKVILTDDIILKCDWMPGEMGDHAPMHKAFDYDLIKYNDLYNTIGCWKHLKIPLYNWKKSPDVWERRFNV